MNDRPVAMKPKDPDYVSLANDFAREMADRFSGTELREMSHTIRDVFRNKISVTIEETEDNVKRSNEQISVLKDCLEGI